MDENKINELLKISKTIKILYVEDNKDIRESTSQLLKRCFDTVGIAVNGKDGIEKYLDFYSKNGYYYDLVISDIKMPDMDGSQMCKEIIDINKKQSILVISADTSSNLLINLIDIGVNKFIEKPTDTKDLIDTLDKITKEIITKKKNIEYLKDIEELNISLEQKIEQEIQKNNRLQKLAITDNLTGLNNRAQLDNLLDFEIKKAKRCQINGCQINVSIIFIDIDRFKSINDTYGHQVGDQILKDFSKIMQNNIRETDTLGRWGGEEFLIISHETNLKGSLALAENLRKKIENTVFKDVKNITASFGVATFENKDSIDSLLNKADNALYKAKHSGRNKVCIHKKDNIKNETKANLE